MDETEPLLAKGQALLAAAAGKAADGRVRLLSFNADLVHRPAPDEVVTGTAEIMRATRSVIFVSGRLMAADRPLMTLAGVYQIES